MLLINKINRRCDDLEHNIVCPKKLEKCRFGCHIVSNLG